MDRPNTDNEDPPPQSPTRKKSVFQAPIEAVARSVRKISSQEALAGRNNYDTLPDDVRETVTMGDAVDGPQRIAFSRQENGGVINPVYHEDEVGNKPNWPPPHPPAVTLMSDDAGPSRKISWSIRKISTTRRPEIVVSPAELSQRAKDLQEEGISNPAFENAENDEDDRFTPLPSFPNRHLDDAAAARTRRISVGFNPKERVPTVQSYMGNVNDTRPTLEDLRVDTVLSGDDAVRQTGNEQRLKRGNLGWIRGVVLWTILNLWGVMLFLRIAWMNAQAGMGMFLVVILLATTIAILTSLSTSAISTNGEIGVGGTYFMISRSLGPQFGAAIGVIFSLANAISVSLNIQGFADTVQNLLEEHHLGMVDAANDVRIIGVITLVALTGFTFFGMEIASRLQLVFFVILLAAIANIVIGSIIPPTLEMQAKGFVGYSNALFRENFYPAYQDDQFGANDFMSVFGVFFPSVTGILAGSSITGDLKDPSGAIPKGTICAILFTSFTYILVGWCTASVTLRHASGNVADIFAGNLTSCHHDQYNAATACKEGMINNMEIMEVVGHFRPIILAGIFSATLSTALGCINFSPKIFQALCRDNIFPGIHVFGKGYTKADEPYRAYILVLIVAVIFIMPADLNFISNIVSNCFLLTYTLVNYAVFDASFSNSPGWRPTFRYYNKWLSLATAIACFIIMFFLDWKSAVIAVGIIFLLWLYVYYKNPHVNWGTSVQANAYKKALSDMHALIKVEDHVKNWRPQILALTGMPYARPALTYLANGITRGTGLLICGHVLVGKSVKERRTMGQEAYKWLRRRKIHAFYDYVAAKNTSEGIRALIQTSGLGKLKPNILMMGFPNGWRSSNETALDEYVGAINEAFDANLGVIIAYAKEGFNITEAVNFEQLVAENAKDLKKEAKKLRSETKLHDVMVNAIPLEVRREGNTPEMEARILLAERFQPAKKERGLDGEIHIWWLYDDGGLTLLIPHLLTLHNPWHHSKLKVFCLAGQDKEAAKTEMGGLLDKFRIKYTEVIPVDLEIPPSREQTRWFEDLMDDLRDVSHVKSTVKQRKTSGMGVITEKDIQTFGNRTMKQIRLRELLLEHSLSSTLNVVTMPLPKAGQSSTFYMAVLHSLTSDLPPTLLIRGAQENVLTYYC
ncbi:hypothetical protein RvY_06735 [Ramazzottius varieornatus]|uniref:Solute carrier family 12 member 3 n=1 Tax=Ramazzottius varieornatus TaxID=947166 RepID=A0A1D1UZL2_RAMVA|nr:hypothetical protein RvY_06735 [Ramazzottius varieornatus]